MNDFKLQDSICRSIMNEPEITDGGIAGGRLGAAAYLLGYARIKGDEQIAERGGNLLRKAIMDIHSLNKGLLHGKWGIIPVIRFLLSAEMITLSESVLQMLENIREEEFFIYGSVPVKIYMEDPFLTDVFILRDMYEITAEVLKKLEYRERLISYVEECGYLLTESFPPIFSPDRLTDCQLHSMTLFLGYAYRERFYPFKTLEICASLKDFIKERGYSETVDGWILSRMLPAGDGTVNLPEDETEMLCFLNEVGYYAWLYRDSKLLDDLLDDERRSRIALRLDCGEIGWRDTLGIGLGFLAGDEDRGIFQYLLESEEFSGYIGGRYDNPEKFDMADGRLKSDFFSISAEPSLMSDLTFCLPVRIDSPERMRNLKAVINFYLKNSEARFIILEADKDRHVNLADNPRIDYIFVDDSKEIFHRTRYINIMLRRCPTRFAAIWDADVIAPVSQIEEAVSMLHNPANVIVYPYGGRLRNTMDFISNCFARSLDIRVLSEFPQNSLLMCAYHSVGGGFIADRDCYLRYGGENENFTGWGPEDVERWKRLEILGYKPRRTDGEMYHLSHPRGINSKAKDPDTMFRTRSELAKVCGMMPDELREYIRRF